ncbi:MAG: hypothetical protein JXR37_19075 [Kiritimatiellae bacterium]|nr:hypothetical protein [Kiritimatiellia bacterium]
MAEIWEPRTFRVGRRTRAPFDGYLNSLGRNPIARGDPEQEIMNIGERVAGFVKPAQAVSPRKRLEVEPGRACS